MTLSQPLAGIFPGARASVLNVLAGPEAAFTGREVQRLADPPASLKAVQTALHALVAEGLVLRSEVGKAHQYRFNFDHVTAPGIMAILDAREEMFRRLTHMVSGWESPPVAVWVFGSVATSSETSDSDIDLLVVRSDDIKSEQAAWEAQMRELYASVPLWTGLSCEVLEMSSTDVRHGWRSQEAVLQDVWRTGRVLWGPSIHEWFMELRGVSVDGESGAEPLAQVRRVP